MSWAPPGTAPSWPTAQGTPASTTPQTSTSTSLSTDRPSGSSFAPFRPSNLEPGKPLNRQGATGGRQGRQERYPGPSFKGTLWGGGVRRTRCVPNPLNLSVLGVLAVDESRYGVNCSGISDRGHFTLDCGTRGRSIRLD